MQQIKTLVLFFQIQHFVFVNSVPDEIEVFGREGVDIWGGPGEFVVKPQYVTRI